MSLRLLGEDVVFLQRFLKCAGFYTGRLDGIWGPKTDAGFTGFVNESDSIARRLGTFDRMSEAQIRTLQPKTQELARRFLATVLEAGIPVRIISGTRTYAAQNVLYRKGRFGNPPPPVTWAKGGQSNHNFGLAWDVGVFQNGSYLGESPLYTRAAEVGLTPKLEWGGNWRKKVDRPHYQVKSAGPIATIREHFEAGAAFV